MRIQSHFKDYYDWANPYRETDDRSFFWKRDMSAYEINPNDMFPKRAHGGRRDHGRRRHWPRFEKILYREDDSPPWEAKQVYVTVGDQTVSFYARFPDPSELSNDETYYKLPHKAEQVNIMGQTYISPYAATIPLPVCSTSSDFPRKEWVPSGYAFEPAPDIRECVEDRTPNTDPQVFPTSKYPLFTKMQLQQKTPILLFRGGDHHIIVVENPCLIHYGIQNVLTDPQQVYQHLEMWFTDGKFNADPPSPQTDIQKVVSHGFDKKKSFRNMPRD